MAKILINAAAATAGGGVTYLHNVLPRLAGNEHGHRFVVIVPSNDYAGCGNERLRIEIAPPRSLPARLWWEQWSLRSHLRGIDGLISLGNFALLAAPVPQILFSRNELYFSPHFERDLRQRGLYGALVGHRLKSRLARLSIKRARINVVPSAAFAERIRSFDGLGDIDFAVLPFGFDHSIFTADDEPPQLNLNAGCRRLLFVSHYNYFRNFETLIRALPLIKTQLKAQTGEDVQLILTTDIKRGASYGGYDATAAAELIDRLGVYDSIAMLGAIPYTKLHHLYRQGDLFVCPSYAESFGHPLVEAMAAGLPIAAANLPVHREVCGDAAVYFDVFDEKELAAQCVRVLTDEALSARLKANGAQRHQRFSWDEHVGGLLALIERCLQ